MSCPRITVYRSLEDYHSLKDGKVVPIGETLPETIEIVGEKLGMQLDGLQSINGGAIDDLSIIRDGDVLLATTNPRLCFTPTERASPSSGPVTRGTSPSVPSPSSLHCGSATPDDITKPPTPLNLQDPTMFALKKCSTHVSPNAASRNDWVRLNVGGRIFATTRATLTSDPFSMLARMFESDWFSATDDSGAFLIDRSPEYFEPLLNFLRHGKLILNQGLNPQGVLEEATFFGITKAIEPLEALVQVADLSSDGHFTRKQFVKMITATSSSACLRCQGINLESVDLSNLDLRNINFKCANLRFCNFSKSNLTNCVLERADLYKANLEEAILQCVHMPRANLEGAVLKGCSMDERLGVSTNLEGANLKGAIFDNSQMNGVNLRLASLKGAHLRSCNLRYSIMAGTDLENSDLTGCDLLQANLRGANLAGVNFDGIITPLHMSQTVNVNVQQSVPPDVGQSTPPLSD